MLDADVGVGVEDMEIEASSSSSSRMAGRSGFGWRWYMLVDASASSCGGGVGACYAGIGLNRLKFDPFCVWFGVAIGRWRRSNDCHGFILLIVEQPARMRSNDINARDVLLAFNGKFHV